MALCQGATSLKPGAFRDPIRRAVGAVDLSARLAEREFDNDVHFLASAPDGIRFGPALTLTFSFQLEPVREDGDVRMTTRRYDYTLSPATRPDEIVFGWHWHPASKRSHITYPHVHVPAATSFSTRHIPTGRVALEDVILFGFDDLDVPLAYPTARDVVVTVSDRHKQYRSWS